MAPVAMQTRVARAEVHAGGGCQNGQQLGFRWAVKA
jgi:hypothetical protein